MTRRQAGWPVAVHAIGDRANRNALDAFEATRDVWQPRGLRQRIEHTQCLDPVDIPRFAELGVACSVQFTHAPSDRDLAERFWGDRLDGTYAFRSLLDSGAVVANGSDAPVEELDPSAGIRAGVLRTIDGRPAWRPERGAHRRAGDHRVDRDPRLARRRRAPPGPSAPRLPGRPRRALARSLHVPAGRRSSRSRSWPRWSAGAGCTTPRPGDRRAGAPARRLHSFLTAPT